MPGQVSLGSTTTTSAALTIAAVLTAERPPIVSAVVLATGAIDRSVPVPVGAFAVATTASGTTAAVLSHRTVATMIDLADGAPGPQVPISATATAVALSPDGGTLYACLSDGTVFAVRTATGQKARTYAVQRATGATALAVTPKGTTLYEGSQSGIYPVDLASGEVGAPLPVVGQPSIRALAITSADARLVDVATPSGGVEAGQLTSYQLATRAAPTPIDLSHPAAGVMVTPAGTTAYVATGTAGGTTAIVPIDLATGASGPAIAVSGGATSIALAS